MPAIAGCDIWFKDSQGKYLSIDVTCPTNIIVDAGKNLKSYVQGLDDLGLSADYEEGSRISIPACFCEWVGKDFSQRALDGSFHSKVSSAIEIGSNNNKDWF